MTKDKAIEVLKRRRQNSKLGNALHQYADPSEGMEAIAALSPKWAAIFAENERTLIKDHPGYKITVAAFLREAVPVERVVLSSNGQTRNALEKSVECHTKAIAEARLHGWGQALAHHTSHLERTLAHLAEIDGIVGGTIESEERPNSMIAGNGRRVRWINIVAKS